MITHLVIILRGCQSRGFSSCIECESKFKLKYEFYFNLLCFMLMLCWLSLNKSEKKKRRKETFLYPSAGRSAGEVTSLLDGVSDYHFQLKTDLSMLQHGISLAKGIDTAHRAILRLSHHSDLCRHGRLVVYLHCDAVLSVKCVCTKAPLPLFQGTAHMRWAQSLAYTGHTFSILLLLKDSSVSLKYCTQSTPGQLALLRTSHSQFIIRTVLSEYLSIF